MVVQGSVFKMSPHQRDMERWNRCMGMAISEMKVSDIGGGRAPFGNHLSLLFLTPRGPSTVILKHTGMDRRHYAQILFTDSLSWLK